MDDKTNRWFERMGHEPPTHISHDLKPEDIAKKVEPANARNWRQQGNQLMADTDFGPLVQHIPTDMIMTGTDEQGLPTFRKVDI